MILVWIAAWTLASVLACLSVHRWPSRRRSPALLSCAVVVVLVGGPWLAGWSFRSDTLGYLAAPVVVFAAALPLSAVTVRRQAAGLHALVAVGSLLAGPGLALDYYWSKTAAGPYLVGPLRDGHRYELTVTGAAWGSDHLRSRVVWSPHWAPFAEQAVVSRWSPPEGGMAQELNARDAGNGDGRYLAVVYGDDEVDRVPY